MGRPPDPGATEVSRLRKLSLHSRSQKSVAHCVEGDHDRAPLKGRMIVQSGPLCSYLLQP